jgi:hypothetical protein
MSASKRINTGNYTITTFPNDGNPSGNVDITTNTLMVYGNLRVTGTTTNVQAYDTTLSIFRLNANLTVANSPAPGFSGIENKRGSQPSVGLYWAEDGIFQGQWIANNSVGNAGPILTSYNVKVNQTTNNPIGNVGYTVVSGNTAGTGGSGLFVNAGTSSAELVTTLGAKKYAIIFG